VTGSSASPYVGGGIINKKPDPNFVPARTHTTTTTTYTRPSTTIYTSPAPAGGVFFLGREGLVDKLRLCPGSPGCTLPGEWLGVGGPHRGPRPSFIT
jgi:hypothetical protein